MYASLRSRVNESCDVDSHENGMPQEGSHDQVTPWQLHTIALALKASESKWKLTKKQPFSNRVILIIYIVIFCTN